MCGSLQLGEACIILKVQTYSHYFEGVNIYTLREILQFH